MTDIRWSTLAVETCLANGIDHFFIAPGSRCTPLTLAVARNPRVIVTQHFDERGLAFSALGYARATGKPGVFICTSGTAVANAFPAVIEAAMECVPLLLFTADRPPELRGTGANQTIDQQHIFGKYVRWFYDMPSSAEEIPNECMQSISESNGDPLVTGDQFVPADQFVCKQVSSAIANASNGPAHLNWMFREPFSFDDDYVLTESDTKGVAALTCDSNREHDQKVGEPKIELTGQTLIVVGGCRPHEAAESLRLATHLHAPIAADVTSGLRCLSTDLPAKYRLPEPDTIIHLGGRIVSKVWLQWTATLKSTRFIHVTPHDVTINPHHLEVERHVTPLDALPNKFVGDKTSSEFVNAWEAAEEQRRGAITHVIENTHSSSQTKTKISEPAIAHAVGELILPGHGLFIGNSSPIRDVDAYACWPSSHNIAVAANRGASGIDGLLATAVGFANGLGRSTTVLLGDLSALHDLNSLALVAQSDIPIIVLIVNNHGGGIFDRLPVANRSKHFEQYFATPHRVGFEHAAAMFGLPYQQITELSTFETVYRETVRETETQHPSETDERPVSRVFELMTNRKFNAEVRQQIESEFTK